MGLELLYGSGTAIVGAFMIVPGILLDPHYSQYSLYKVDYKNYLSALELRYETCQFLPFHCISNRTNTY